MSRRVRVWYRKAVKARRGMSGFVASRNVVAAQGSRGAFGFGEAMRGNASQSSQGQAGHVMSRNGTASHGKLCQREAVVKSLGWLGWAAQVMAARGSQVPARSGEDGSV
jgi:hypothetical protein